ncbi:MAG: MFS transporter [Chloroflexi bacterium]|nr:MFS transporter [Chloroflexota bacterium]
MITTESRHGRPGRAGLPGSARPTRARYWVIVFAITLAIITYIDRVCISKAAPLIQQDLGLSKLQMGYAFAAFGWAYALFEIPGGWLGDIMGPRKVLMRVVVMWSVFTAATGWTWNLISLAVCRFLFGMGEAGCFPNLTKAFTIWLPAVERVRAQGIMWLSARWGGAFTPLLVAWVLSFVSWRWAFVLFGALGVVWAVFFYRWFRDHPRQHPGVNAGELALLNSAEKNIVAHGQVPWGKFVASRTVWLLWAQYFCMSYGWYFYITWMPTYLNESFPQLSDLQRTLLNCIPLFFGGLGSIVCGLISAPMARALGSVAQTRRLMAFLGLTGAAVMLLVSIQFKNPLLAVLSVGLASFCNDLAMPGAWGACMDVGGRFAGSLSGSMNMMGNAGGALGPVVVPLVLKAAHDNWNVNFTVFAAVYFLGALCWLFIDPVTPLEKEAQVEGPHPPTG